MPRPLQAAEDARNVLSRAADFYKKAGLRPANWTNRREPNSFDSTVRQKAVDFCKKLSNEELGALARHLGSAAARLRLNAVYRHDMMDELGKVENEVAFQIAGVGVILFWYEQEVAA